MTDTTLQGRKVALLVTDGFEQLELTSPRDALQQCGAEAVIVAPKSGQVRGWEHTEWGDIFDVDMDIETAKPEDFDAVVLPGGVMNPDKLRREGKVISFLRAFWNQGRPVAAICHGPWTLIDAELVRGQRMTSYPSISKDLINAGADWVDEQVVVDGNLITSRKPDDLDAFNNALIEMLAAREPVHAGAQS